MSWNWAWDNSRRRMWRDPSGDWYSSSDGRSYSSDHYNKNDPWTSWNSRDARTRANDRWHYGNNSWWSDDTDKHGRDQQAFETSGVQGEAIDALVVDTIASPIVDEVPLKAHCFQREAAAQN